MRSPNGTLYAERRMSLTNGVYKEIENLYRHWQKDPCWGPAVWCITQRKQKPQQPVEDAIRKQGIWDLDALDLGENTRDAEVKAHFAKIKAAGLAALGVKESK